MSRTWEFWVPGIPPGPNHRLHWMARRLRTRALADPLAWEVRSIRPDRPLPHARVSYAVYSNIKDYDNLVSCCKGLGDALVVGGLLAGDSMREIEVAYTAHSPRGVGRGIRIVVEEV